jgi:antitoxin (DNA-binding transcriptional repressor) of toxin-antitoxin stability system
MSIDDNNVEQLDAHGKPVARLIPIGSGRADLIGSMKGKVQVKGAVFSTGIKWDAES